MSTALAAAGALDGQGWKQIGLLGLAFALSSLIGLEREWRQKSAGLRTHTLVGVGAALFLMVSKYGFGDVLQTGRVVLDPSRVAAQIVTGIGFLGGGLIFVRGEGVRGLTTAAVVWVTAAVGMACGAGLALLAIVVTAGHFLVVIGYAPLARTLPRSRYLGFDVRVVYEDGRGILRKVLAECTERGFGIGRIATQRIEGGAIAGVPAVSVTMQVQGRGEPDDLAVSLDGMEGVIEVTTSGHGDDGD